MNAPFLIPGIFRFIISRREIFFVRTHTVPAMNSFLITLTGSIVYKIERSFRDASVHSIRPVMSDLKKKCRRIF
jgi:hypothetical protein